MFTKFYSQQNYSTKHQYVSFATRIYGKIQIDKHICLDLKFIFSMFNTEKEKLYKDGNRNAIFMRNMI